MTDLNTVIGLKKADFYLLIGLVQKPVYQIFKIINVISPNLLYIITNNHNENQFIIIILANDIHGLKILITGILQQEINEYDLSMFSITTHTNLGMKVHTMLFLISVSL